MILSARYTAPGTAVAITMTDGPVWHTDASLPADTDIRRALAKWVEAGGVIAPYVAPPPSPPRVPAEVSRGQALIALFQAAGITDAMIEAKIAAIPDGTERYIARVRFQEPRWRRDSPFISWGAAEFGLTEAETDALFIPASDL